MRPAREEPSSLTRFAGSDYVTPDTTLVGAGGQEVWRFRAAAEGTSSLELTYQRASGETAGEPFQITVEVTA
jgi:predicted secreted protein